MRLLTKIWLSTSVAITFLFLVAGWIVWQHVVSETQSQLRHEVATSMQAYRSLWRERAQSLAALSAQIASAPQVRAAFGTGDAATIADTSGELLRSLERHLGDRGLVVVTEPKGRVIARLASGGDAHMPDRMPLVEHANARFPEQQTGFGMMDTDLYQFVITPVYVQAGRGLALINVLVTGFQVTDAVAAQLRTSTGSDFVFASEGRILASTLGPSPPEDRVELSEPLRDVEGRVVGSLTALRSLEAATAGYAALRRQIAVIWLVSLALSSLITFALARRIVGPIEALDHAAAEVGRENYESRVEPVTNDEIGRLARTFNAMCASIQQARQELIRNERLHTIGRLAGSIVHDMRNPLAAIYGSSEMLLHSELPDHQRKRLAANLYKASKKIQDMLEDLLNVTRGGTPELREECLLWEIVQAALDPLRSVAEAQRVEITVNVPTDKLVAADPRRLERAFANLLVNALEAMPEGGRIQVDAELADNSITLRVADTGPGIHPDVRSRLFEPFASAGKKNGTGLGLALARQTVLDHGGDMWAESEAGRGASFFIRLPLAQSVAAEVRD
jgi:signal transduction histidine kinase